MSAIQTISSKKVIKDRLNNGQCVHCGVQTHSVIRKLFQQPQKIPLNIPGRVEHGCCMSASCQQAGNNVTLDTSERSSKISAQGMVNIAGVATSLTGAVLSGFGIDAGEFMVDIGTAVMDASSSISQSVSGTPSSRSMAEIHQQSQQAALPMSGMLCAAPTNILSSIKCPNHHSTEPTPIGGKCDLCGAIENGSTMMVGCRKCDWDICSSCQSQALMGDPLQTCPLNHTAYRTLNIWPQFRCWYCLADVPQYAPAYICRICDWGTCANGNCRHAGARTPPMKCPCGHDACLSKVPAHLGFYCDICYVNLAPGEEMYCCLVCPNMWSACVQHRVD